MEVNLDPLSLTLAVFSFLGSIFFSLSELSIFVIDRVKLSRIIKSRRKHSKYLRLLLRNHRKTLITILFFNLLMNTILAISLQNVLMGLSAVITTIIISLVTVIFCESLPKILGLSVADNIVVIISRIIYVLYEAILPVSTLMEKQILALTGRRQKTVKISKFDQVIRIIKRNIKSTFLHQLIKIMEIDVKDIITPISEVTLISTEASYKEVIQVIKESQSDYVYVYDGTKNNIIGVIQVTDLVSTATKPGEKIYKHIKPVNFVAETKKVIDLVKELLTKYTDKTVIVDEYGNMIGVTSFEDITKLILERSGNEIQKVSEKTFIVNGEMLISDFNEYFLKDIESKFFNNISGFLLDNFGKIPSVGEKIKLNGIEFEILEMDKEKISKVKVKI